MTSPLLTNHLRANRKRLALSQNEVAFLLGTEKGSKVCRYEQFIRTPNFETALAYEVICKRAMSELFPGLYQKAETKVAARAKALVEAMGSGKSGQRAARKREVLADLAALTS